MLNDKHFKILKYNAKSGDVFSNTDIKGGVVVSYHDTTKSFGAIEVFTPFDELNSILRKTVHSGLFESFSSIVESAYSYHLTDAIYQENSELSNRLSKGHEFDFKSNIFEIMPEVFYESQPDDNYEYIQVLGRKNSQRTLMWIKKSYVTETTNLNKYKVFVAGANGCGAIGETLSTPLIGTPLIGNTESFISIGSFDSRDESEACMKYIKTKFARTLLGVLKVTQAITPSKWKYVPMQDFTSKSDIDWSKSIPEIDQQLYKKYGLSQEEINFIESKVKEMT